MITVRKLKSFTILELSISMLISAIVIGIAYYAYEVFSRSYNEYNVKRSELADVIMLDKLLNRDFHKASFIERTSTGILIKNSLDEINYDFSTGKIVRKSEINDTFKIDNEQLLTQFDNKNLIENINNTGNLIDELFFTINCQGHTIPLHYLKKYSAADLIKIQSDASN